jgi:serine/threonine protein kinase
METDLDRVINSRQGLSIDHVRFFVYQILRGLKYIHSANVLHRDLKPSNLLVNSNCDLKICDFGLARVVEEDSESLTEYVVTRWYRAPELLLACQNYTTAIDVWSVGCIFAELLLRQPFLPGQDTVSQLKLICETLGKPSLSELDFITSERTRRFVTTVKPKPKVPMQDIFVKFRSESSALDLISRMLSFNPNGRITVDEALSHPFMSSLHNPENEPLADFTFSFPFDNEELSSEVVQELVWEELRELHPDIPLKPRVTFAARRSSRDMEVDNSAENKSSPDQYRRK